MRTSNIEIVMYAYIYIYIYPCSLFILDIAICISVLPKDLWSAETLSVSGSEDWPVK